MASDRLYLVFSLPNHPGVAVYLHRTAELSDGTRGTTPVVQPVFDDDVERSQVWTNPEFAVHARDYWRKRGFCVVIKDRHGQVLFERENTEEPRFDDSRVPRFVPFTNGLGLIVTPGNTPSGPTWFVRASDIPFFTADARHTAIESVSGDTPESAAQRAVDSWGPQILFADPDAADKQKAERQQQASQQTPFMPRLRPGDCR